MIAEFYAEVEEKRLRTLRFRNPTSEEINARLDASLEYELFRCLTEHPNNPNKETHDRL